MKNSNSGYEQKTIIREMIFAAYFGGSITKESVTSRLEISVRQFYRLQKKYKQNKSLKHGLYSQPSNHQINPKIKESVISLYRTKYCGSNYEHYCDMLDLHEGITVKPDCVRKWLLEAKLTLPRNKNTKKVTTWREPKAKFNDMVQIDGTFGYFLGSELLCLMHLVDDATRTSMAILYKVECTQSALQLLYNWCLKYGIPKSIYSDRHSTYKVNKSRYLTVEEELEGQMLKLTDFGKVCQKIGIEQKFAYSPQAKGRVENKHKLYKDRCIKEIKWLNYSTIEQVNQFLTNKGGFTDRLNQKFAIAAREANPAVVLPTDTELAHYFTLDNTRVVRNDYTVQFNKIVYQLSRKTVVNHRAKVNIKQYLDGRIAIFAGNIELEYFIVENYLPPIKANRVNKPAISIKHYRLPITHPFKQNYKKSRTVFKLPKDNYLQLLGSYYE